MNSNTKLYKIISNDELSKMKISLSRKYYYITDNDIVEIKEQLFENNSNDKMYQLVDEDYTWNPKVHNLYLDLCVNIKNCKCIFGENASCYEDAIIGIGLSWKPDKSKIKHCVKIGEFSALDTEKTFIKNSVLIENLSSNATFKIFFYVVKPGKNNGCNFFGNERGIVIHESSEWTIIVNGTGSIFPIFEIEDDKGPLWSFMCDNIVDISEDYFDSEHIQIVINKKHPAYEFIHPKSETFNHMFLNDIMSSAISMIIMNLRSLQINGKIDLNADFESGSILQALKYFSEKLDFKINDSYENLCKSIKSFFDKEC